MSIPHQVGTWEVYVLRCQHEKYYVGSTQNYANRIKRHFEGSGAQWTRRYPPMEVAYTKMCSNPVSAREEEDMEVKRLMTIHGIGNVRGGSYSQLILDHISVTALERELTHLQDLCLHCGKAGHYASECPALGTAIEGSTEEEDGDTEMHTDSTEYMEEYDSDTTESNNDDSLLYDYFAELFD